MTRPDNQTHENLLRATTNAAIMTTAATQDSHPDCRAPLSQIVALQAEFCISRNGLDICALSDAGLFKGYPNLMRKVLKYLSGHAKKGAKPNVEASLSAEFNRTHNAARLAAVKSGVVTSPARASFLWPAGGIQDNSVNRLLLMSSSEHHLASAPMAMFLKSEKLS